MGITLYLYHSAYFKDLNLIITFSISIVTMAISIVALIISLITFLSIDSVNSVTSMEGNVLENPNYTMAFSDLIKKYQNCYNEKEFEEEIFRNISTLLKEKNKTCKEFTDCVQVVIDHLLWFAYIDIQEESCQKKIQKLINELYKTFTKLNAWSNGKQYLLDENLKLITYVLIYQASRKNLEYIIEKGELNNIRGKILSNPVSMTIYYDYLGLEYRSKAVNCIKEICSIEDDEYLINNMIIIQNKKFSDEQLNKITFYLNKSIDYLYKAEIIAKDDLLWEGYIKFNIARVILLKSLIDKLDKSDFEMSIDEAIYARRSIHYIFFSNQDCENSYLFLQFKKELYYSEIIKLLYKSLVNKITDTDLFLVSEVKEFMCNKEHYINKRIVDYCNSILSYNINIDNK